jgi:hypothetical protein
MQKDEFYKYAEHPELLDKESIALLTELVNAFPYFQTARLLLTKALHEQKNFYFDSQLKITASYFSDRKQLHHFINGNASGNNLMEEKKEIIPVIELKIEEVIIKEEVIAELGNTTPLYKETIDVPDLENNAIVEIEEEVVVELENIPEEKEESLLDILASITKKEPEVEETVIETVFVEVFENEIEEELKIEAPIEKEITIDKDSKHSFLEWLKELNKGANIPQNPEIPEKEAAQEKNIDAVKKDIQEGIIENFMKTNPVIPPPRKEFYSPVNMAKLSIMENDDLCSETLAKIYLDQGNYARAKSMFERLSLKYPQKSVYFAARIKEINDIINK